MTAQSCRWTYRTTFSETATQAKGQYGNSCHRAPGRGDDKRDAPDSDARGIGRNRRQRTVKRQRPKPGPGQHTVRGEPAGIARNRPGAMNRPIIRPICALSRPKVRIWHLKERLMNFSAQLVP